MRSPSFNQNQEALTTDVQTWIGFAAIVLVIVATIVGQLTTEKSAQVLADLTMIFGTFYISFLISRHFALVTSRKELQDLAEASGARIFLLSSQMKDLVQDVYNYKSDGSTSNIYYEVMR